MKLKYLLAISLVCFLTVWSASAGEKLVKIAAEPQEAAIYVDNVFIGNGYGEFPKPKKKNSVAVIRIECDGYRTVNTRYYGGDKRESLSFKLIADGFMQGSVASGAVNKFFTVEIAPEFYTKADDGKVDATQAWKMLHQILLNYFDEIETTDFYSGFVQTPWHYSKFSMSDKQIRTRVTIRDISNPDLVAFQIKISTEVAGVSLGKHGEFTEIDRIPKDYESLIQELQTRVGKLYGK